MVSALEELAEEFGDAGLVLLVLASASAGGRGGRRHLSQDIGRRGLLAAVLLLLLLLRLPRTTAILAQETGEEKEEKEGERKRGRGGKESYEIKLEFEFRFTATDRKIAYYAVVVIAQFATLFDSLKFSRKITLKIGFQPTRDGQMKNVTQLMHFRLRLTLPNDFGSRGWRMTLLLVELGVTLRTRTGVIATFPKIENMHHISKSTKEGINVVKYFVSFSLLLSC